MLKSSTHSISLAILLFSVTFSAVAMEGSGTLQDPYQINNCGDLQYMNQKLSANYVLANDIDCSDTMDWNHGEGFVPIGTNAEPFMGHFDGQNHVISNLFINRPSQSAVGLFGATFGNAASIVNLKLVGVNITGGNDVGGLVGVTGDTISGEISNVEVTGHVSGNMRVGGLIGNAGNQISNSAAAGSVTGASNVGGLIGFASVISNVSHSYATNSVSSKNGAGGLIGFANGGNITNSYATGNVS